jgi:hypothetical protein
MNSTFFPDITPVQFNPAHNKPILKFRLLQLNFLINNKGGVYAIKS